MKVSVVAPVRNEERSLAALLDSLLTQTVHPDEILLADGGSTDATVAIGRSYLDRGVRVLEIGPAYPGRARNAGIRAARNEWIALIDAGCVAKPRWLESLLAARDRLGKEPCVVFGECLPSLTDRWDEAQALTSVAPPDPESGLHPPFIASSLLHRAAWEEVGGFPEHLRAAEDLLFIEWIEKSRVPTARAAEAVVLWRLARGPAGVWKRFRLYSAHHLAAGLFRTWHLRVMSMDLAALAFLLGVFVWPPAMLPVVVGGSARLLRTVWKRRLNLPRGQAFRLDHLFRVAILLFLADAAAWAGGIDFLSGREPPR